MRQKGSGKMFPPQSDPYGVVVEHGLAISDLSVQRLYMLVKLIVDLSVHVSRSDELDAADVRGVAKSYTFIQQNSAAH